MLKRVRDRYLSWRSYHRTCRELSALGARELDDLGISRSEISFVAREHSKRS